MTDEEIILCILHYVYRDDAQVQRIAQILSTHSTTVYGLLTMPMHVMHALGLSNERRLLNFLSLLREYAIRASTLPKKTIFSEMNVALFAKMLLLRIGHLTTEVILGVLLTKEKRFMCIENVALGSVNTAVFDVKTVVETLEAYRCPYIILVHNHPSGACLPSHEDIQATKDIAQACHARGYEVLDHYIVTHNAVYSMYTERYCCVV